MSRAQLVVIAGALFAAWLVLGAVMEGRVEFFAPAGQNTAQPIAGTNQEPAPLSGTVPLDVHTRQPMPEGLAHLQFAADAVRCPVSSRSAVMASCVVERYVKMRDKALLWRATYERLEGLERAYWAALAREGLTQRVEHVPTAATP